MVVYKRSPFIHSRYSSRSWFCFLIFDHTLIRIFCALQHYVGHTAVCIYNFESIGLANKYCVCVWYVVCYILWVSNYSVSQLTRQHRPQWGMGHEHDYVVVVVVVVMFIWIANIVQKVPSVEVAHWYVCGAYFLPSTACRSYNSHPNVLFSRNDCRRGCERREVEVDQPVTTTAQFVEYQKLTRMSGRTKERSKIEHVERIMREKVNRPRENNNL